VDTSVHIPIVFTNTFQYRGNERPIKISQIDLKV